MQAVDYDGRPSWDRYFMTMAFIASRRSIDPNTKCGCIIVSKDHRVLATGYNGPVRGSKDDEIPLTRPQKYMHFIHAELNAILSYRSTSFEGATCYVTGVPCFECMRNLVQCGITRIVYPSDIPVPVCVEDKDEEARKILLSHHPHVEVMTMPVHEAFVELDNTMRYITEKQEAYQKQLNQDWERRPTT